MPLRILVDLQGAQSGSRLRGIGRYSLGLTKAIARNCGDDQLFILLSDQFTETLDAIHANFEHVLSADRFLTFTSRGPVSAIPPENDWRRRIAEIMREYVIDILSPDVMLVTSLFEGVHDDAVTSIGD